MQQIHAEGSVRHAEKRRRGTCQFANRIARASLDAYEHSVPQSYRDANKQTCVAAIVAHIRTADVEGNNEASNTTSSHHLQVMGLGVGTKFLPNYILQEEKLWGTESSDENKNNSEQYYGKRIRDCHAEVLARRAFKCQLSLEILSDLNGPSNGNKKNTDDSCRGSDFIEAGYVPILERVNNDDNTSIRYRLRPDVTLHFYASSAPCKCGVNDVKITLFKPVSYSEVN